MPRQGNPDTSFQPVNRGFDAVVHGEKYQEPLLDSINRVYDSSNDLIHQAQNSHISRTREAMEAVLRSKHSSIQWKDDLLKISH
jgi:hypothetical protein